MTDQAKAVVEAFERLTTEEQTQAYLMIEKLWKGQQGNGTASNMPTHDFNE
jgi:ribosomal protein S12 methylthiotransferase accessory factor YcaO